MFRRGGGARWREILQLLDETLKQRRSPPRSDLVALLDVVIGRVHVHLEAVRNHEVARVLMPLAVRRTECLFKIFYCCSPLVCSPSLWKGFRHSAQPGRISPPGWSLLPGAPALTRAGLSPARTARLTGRTIQAWYQNPKNTKFGRIQ